MIASCVNRQTTTINEFDHREGSTLNELLQYYGNRIFVKHYIQHL